MVIVGLGAGETSSLLQPWLHGCLCFVVGASTLTGLLLQKRKLCLK